MEDSGKWEEGPGGGEGQPFEKDSFVLQGFNMILPDPTLTSHPTVEQPHLEE